MRNCLKSNQWRSTTDVLRWFKGLEDKKKHTFIKSDIEAFYPSITKKLLMKAINYGKTVTRIEDKEIDIILHVRRAVLADSDEVWIEKENPGFYVPIGVFDDAEAGGDHDQGHIWAL